MIPDFIYESEFWTYAGIGFSAQIIDGALGMAYGTLSTAILLATGVPPLVTSASVHTAQFFTTGLSALSHAWFKNVDKKLFLLLAVSGAAGGVWGALLLGHLDGKLVKPWIAAYLLYVGLYILWRRFVPRKDNPRKRTDLFRGGLGMLGGFLDALGGGWGPMVTSSLIARNEDPRLTIGSVNSAEFFVKTVIAVTFIATATFTFHEIVLGLLAGGVIAAPFGAYVLRFIRPEILITGVGVLIIILSSMTLYQTFF
ncbi:MAG: sulfite exporter TauE/SafE family protein [Alphaproteobacteria bacterium]|nr:sulfite exporter TauE/SafE family protein [Alphaproteobacteria bacterium]